MLFAIPHWVNFQDCKVPMRSKSEETEKVEKVVNEVKKKTKVPVEQNVIDKCFFYLLQIVLH